MKPTILVKHIGEGDYAVTRIFDTLRVLPSWVKIGTELSFGQCIRLNNEYGNETVKEN